MPGYIKTDNVRTLEDALDKIAELKAIYRKQKNKRIDELQKRIAGLEKENAELKEKNVEIIKEANERYRGCQRIDDDNNRIILDLKMKVKDLEKENEKAKKIIRAFVDYEKANAIVLNYNEFLKQAEDFIKE